jgi:hypothetical protein
MATEISNLYSLMKKCLANQKEMHADFSALRRDTSGAYPKNINFDFPDDRDKDKDRPLPTF